MLFSNKKKDSLLLVLDVQSGVARSALVLYREDISPLILFVHSSIIPHRAGTDSRHIINAMVTATSNSINKALHFLSLQKHKRDGIKDIPDKISEVHYVLSSPWILSEAKRMDMTFNRDILITDEILRKLVDEESEIVTDDGNVNRNIIPVEEKIFDVKLNGYSLDNWMGKLANSLAVSFVTSISSAKMVDRFKDLCLQVVHGKDIFFHSSLLLQHIALKEIDANRGVYTIVHVHGEVTDVVEVNNHSCVFFSTYPVGSRTMTQMLAQDLNVDMQTATSMLNIRNTHLSSQAIASSSKSVGKMNDYWFKQLESLLKTGPLSQLGSASFIVSASDGQDDIVAILKDKYPTSSIMIPNIEELVPYVSYGASAERQVMMGQYALAIMKLRR